MPGKFVVVVGLRGSGKSSVLSALPKTKYKVVNIGSVILDVCKKEGILNDRDLERKMPLAVYNRIKSKTYAKIAAMKGNIVLDTHATIEYGRRFVPGLPLYFIKKLNLVAFFYIDADLDTIVNRNRNDVTRNREEIERQVMIDNRTISLATYSYYSAYLNIPIYIINNQQGKLQNARKMFLKDLEEAFGR